MASFLLDNFVGASGSDLTAHTADSGATWAQHPSFTGATRTILFSNNNRIRSASTGTLGERRYLASVTPPAADYEIAVVVFNKSAGNGTTYIGARLDPTANTGYFAGHAGSSNTWQIFKNVAGAFTLLDTAVQAFADDTAAAVLFRVVGTSLELWVDDVLLCSATDASISSAGRIGVALFNQMSDSVGLHIDSIEVAEEFAPGGAGLTPLPSVKVASATKVKVAANAPLALSAPQLTSTAGTTRTGAAAPTLPSVDVAGVGIGVPTEGLGFVVSNPFRVKLQPAVSIAFNVLALPVAEGPLPSPRLESTGELAIQGSDVEEGAVLLPGLTGAATGISAPGTADLRVGSAALALGTLDLAATASTTHDQVQIGGVEYRIYEDPPLEIEDWIEERSTARFHVRDDLGEYSFQARQPVAVYDHFGEKIFGGYIDTVKEVRINQAGAKRHEISCIDNHYKADKRRWTASYENDAMEDIVADIITNRLEPEGVTLASALIDAGPVIGQATFNYARVSECLQTLAERVNYWWRIDHDGILHFRERGTEAAPWTLTGADCIGTPDYTKSSPLYRNRQYIRGGLGLTDPQTYLRDGDGATREFVMGFPLAKVPTVEVNGTPESVGIKGLDTRFSDDAINGKKWFWSKGDPVIVQDSGATVLGIADEIEVTYQGQFNLIAASEDQAAIIARQALEGGGSGIVESVDDDSSLGTRSAALDKAAALLKKYGIEGEQLTFLTLRQGLQPGQVLAVDLPAHDLDSDELLISSILTTRRRTALGTKYYKRVTAILGPSVGSWAKFFLRLTQVPSFIDRLSVGEEGVLDILHTESEDIGIDETVVFTAHACPFPSDSLFPANDLWPC